MEVSNPQNEIVYDQPLLQLRVVHTKDDKFDIECAMMGGPSIGTEVEDEGEAQRITEALRVTYIEALKELQNKMLEALTNISDSNESDRSDS